jgi:LuxR family transcriptional regulator
VNELTHKETQLRWLVSVTHESMAQRQVGRLNNLKPVQLSARESEILRWTADGKSAQEIADILHVTKHTVEFHIKNAVNKLQAANKTSAVVKAMVLGLLG